MLGRFIFFDCFLENNIQSLKSILRNEPTSSTRSPLQDVIWMWPTTQISLTLTLISLPSSSIPRGANSDVILVDNTFWELQSNCKVWGGWNSATSWSSTDSRRSWTAATSWVDLGPYHGLYQPSNWVGVGFKGFARPRPRPLPAGIGLSSMV